jgi:hypothetical protein
MKTYKVKIDRKSIKPNPNAGQKSFMECVSTQAEITLNATHPSLEEKDPRFKMVSTHTSVSGSGSRFKMFSGTTYLVAMPFDELEEFLKKMSIKYGNKLRYQIHNTYNGLDFIHPQPAWLYEYRTTMVKCCHCKSTFPHTKLRDESDYDYIGRDRICPVCDKDDACALEFENFQSIVLKKAGLPAMVYR